MDVHKGRTTRTPWDPVLVQKTIATSPASQAGSGKYCSRKYRGGERCGGRDCATANVTAKDYRRGAPTASGGTPGAEKGKKINTENTEKSGEHREGGRDPSAGMKQRRRPQDDDACPTVNNARLKSRRDAL